ncbi:WGR domain-containing protein [Aphelenchoides fujianensis]|nr:WGR domain-containing protein [Aphelenchoides fujianensis]
MSEKQKKEKKEKKGGEQEDQGEVEAKSLPYSTDYAKTDRSSCTGCKEKIEKGACRMSIRTPSRFFEGLQDNWVPEYAKTGRGKCHGCGEKIEQDAVRLHFRAAYYHPECVKKQGQFYDKAETIQHYGDLKEPDQKALDELFPGWSDEEVRKRKIVHEEEQNELLAKRRRLVDDEERIDQLKNQAQKMSAIREKLTNESKLSNDQLEAILAANNAHLFKKGTKPRNIEWLADVITFGGFEGCPECDGKILYSSTHHTYKCGGNTAENADHECDYSDRNPPRTGFKLPKGMKAKDVEFLKAYEGKKQLQERVYSTAVDANAEEDFLIPVPGVADLTDKAQQKRLERIEKRKKKGGIVKGGLIVDPQFDQAEHCHVYKDKQGKPWQFLVHHIDPQAGKKTFVKLQLVALDKDKDFCFLCRAYGRLDGTWSTSTIRSFKDEPEEAKKAFLKAFHDKTKNNWEDRYDYEEKDGMKLIACDGPIIDMNGILNEEKSKENFEENEVVSFV